MDPGCGVHVAIARAAGKSVRMIEPVDNVSRVGSSIRMGEMSVAKDGAVLRTLLGSCLGVALYDRFQQIGGLAHIVLPEATASTDRPGKFVDTAIPALIEKMSALARSELRLSAKIAGGASMFKTTVAANIGERNVKVCEAVLRERGIVILARHCGGNQGRRMCLHTDNGKVRIEIVGQDAIEL